MSGALTKIPPIDKKILIMYYCYMYKVYLLALACLTALLSFCPESRAEYIRATNEEEVILVSTESEVRMGRSLSKKVEKEFGLDEDTSLQKRIKKIGQKIISDCDRKDITYHFNVLQGRELKPEQRINAFALPGGYVYIFKDMVELMENDDEIAAILAHEVGHIAAKHSVKRLQGSLGAMMFQILGTRMATDAESARKTNAAVAMLMMSYSRDDETAADKLSVKYVKKAGYDPKAVISSIDKMIEMHKKSPIKTYTPYMTHPHLSERKAAVKKEVYGKIDFVDFINTPK